MGRVAGTDRVHFSLRRALVRAGVSLLAGAAVYSAAYGRMPRMAAILLGWNVAGLVLLGLFWATIAVADATETQDVAGSEDPGRTFVYVVIVLASAVSLFAAAALVPGGRGQGTAAHHARVALCLMTVALAWAIGHTAFTFRYAHLFYREDDEGIGGVTFSGENDPTYFDFAYFAFTIGMCFQVSDVCVTSPQIRRTVLLHAVISFLYNSVILAFVLNLVFGSAA
jgi:uncharacterized membrane protein